MKSLITATFCVWMALVGSVTFTGCTHCNCNGDIDCFGDINDVVYICDTGGGCEPDEKDYTGICVKAFPEYTETTETTPPSVQAQDSGKGSLSEIKRLWNPEQMMSTTCNGLARDYNLDDKQKDFTCKFLNERVTKFLDRYAKELSLVLVNLAPFQLTGVLPGAETAKKISDKAYPIFLAAKDTLIKDTNEWRNAILNDEQKKFHDRHLDGLNRQFNLIDRTFKDWRQGKVQSTSPLGGVRLSGGQRVVPEAIAATQRYRLMHESRWGVFVQDFIRLYKLDESQKAEALSILDDLKKQAVAYRKSNAKALSDADNHLSQAKKSRPIDVKAIDAALATMETLNKPIGKWRIDLQTRLSAIPTEKQKSDFAQRSGR